MKNQDYMMKMKRYRVKIEEQNDGKKLYTPQVGNVSIIGKMYLNLFTYWENILAYDGGYCQTARMIHQLHETEQEALDAIEQYKKFITEEESKKTKSVTYKEIK